MAIRDIAASDDLDKLLRSSSVTVLHFWATWCQPCKQMDAVMAELAKDHPTAAFAKIEAEVVDDVTEKYNVATVPYFVVFKGDKVVGTVEGADPPALAAKVAAAAAGQQPGVGAGVAPQPAAGPAAAAPVDVTSRIKQLLESAPVMLFMKGSPDAPRCKFSRQVTDALRELGARYSHFDILGDEEVRQGLKEYSNWPTYPQLYVKGELVGGCDIVMEMYENGELKEQLQLAGALPPPQRPLKDRLESLVNSAPVMLFMKGSAEQPRCGYSRKVCEALSRVGVQFKSFDILGDEEVRQGLKEYSNWPTYPQLYVRGELLGGCDIVQELDADGQLKQEIDTLLQAEGQNGKQERLKKLVTSHPVMLFMKGSPDAPRCGFSAKVVDALRAAKVEFGSFDILGDEEVRQGLKEYSNWPTYPQLYVKGELLGGCDIVQEYAAQGELGNTVDEMLHRMSDTS